AYTWPRLHLASARYVCSNTASQSSKNCYCSGLCQSRKRSGFTEAPCKFAYSINATAKRPTSSAIETALPREFRKVRRARRGGVGLGERQTDHRSLRRVPGGASGETDDR